MFASVMKSTLVLCLLFAVCAQASDKPYRIPDANIEVFRPRGLRVSIPDHTDLRLFAFHSAVNRDLDGLENGDLSQDVLKPKNGRWVFEDKTVKLHIGDVLNYWMFVVKDSLGYRVDNQRFIVSRITEAPSNFFLSEVTPSYPTTSVPQAAGYPQYIPAAPQCICEGCTCPKCTCPTSQRYDPAPSPPPPTTSTPTPSTTQPTTTTTPGQDVALWREILVNLSKEIAQYRDEQLVLKEMNALLIAKLESFGDSNLKKVILGGQISNQDDPLTLVYTVLREKLKIMSPGIVKSAGVNDDGTIIFELATVEDKLNVLINAKQKLQNSKITITDAETSQRPNRQTIDVRNPEMTK